MNMIFLLKSFYRRHVFFRWSRAFPKPSYSQYGEDLILARLLGEVGCVVDIGANNGVSCSNTFLFVLRGARALLFEPIPGIYSRLYDYTKAAGNVITVNEGCSDREGELQFAVEGVLSFATTTEDKAHSAGCRGFLSEHPKFVKVKVRPFAAYLAQYPQFAQPDLLSVDVEGHELNVLNGIDFKCFTPRILVLETHGPSPEGYWLHRDFSEIRGLMLRNGYSHGLSTCGNSMWIRSGDSSWERVAEVLQSTPDLYFEEPPELGVRIQSLWEKSRCA